MALMDFIKKQFIDIIQWTEEGDGTLAWRFPMAGMEIQNGGTLVVRESQMAIFVNEGQVADVFGPGTYKLTTQTLPVLTYLKNWDKLFESPFKSDVYFFSTRQQIDQKWGTPQPITIRDKDFGAVRLRAFGTYDFRIVEPAKFLKEVAGTDQNFRIDEFADTMRSRIISVFTESLAKAQVPVLDVAQRYGELGDALLPMMLFALGVRLTALTRDGLAVGLLGALARPLLGLVIALPLAWALGLEGAARGQLLLFAALPPAVMQFMLADRYQQEPDKVGAMIMLGNALAVVFVPLALALAL